MRIFRFNGEAEVYRIMHEIGVDPYGIKIMLPKTSALLVRLPDVPNVLANILKQEMLALGADAAITRSALIDKNKKADLLLIGQGSQFGGLIKKLKAQPFGLTKLAHDLAENLNNFSKTDFVLTFKHGSLNLKTRTRIMGIINLTPDSFSGDGLYKKSCSNSLYLALEKAQRLVSDGADIIDLGGESSRPGAKSVSVKVELARTIPVVKLLAKKIKIPISIDTTKFEVAKAALDSGAQIINDIGGLRNGKMLKVAADYQATVVIMHMLGKPVQMQKIIRYKSLIDDILLYLKESIVSACAAGIKPEKIIVDPGLGFGKTWQHNLEIIKYLESFKILGKPILFGPSRKSFIAKVVGPDVLSLANGTLASCLLGAQQGANIVRVHEVKAVKQALKLSEAVNKC